MTRRFLIDAVERILWTAIQGFAASILVSGGVDVADLKLAGVAAAMAAAKAIVASRIGNEDSASTAGV